MQIPPGLLPGDPEGWSPVTAGESGATVLRDRTGECYAKLVPAEQADDLAGERDRIAWLDAAGVPVGAVLDWRSADHGACLVTRAVAGVPADQLDAGTLWQAWPAITDLVRQLHRIDATGCPFDRGLATMMSLARTTVAQRRVQTEFLPEDLHDVPPAEILAGLEAELPLRIEQERSEFVVCHGDLCLPNILVHADTRKVSGLIDLGRLGRADPYADIALLLANSRETWPDEDAARRADRAFADRYGTDLDRARQRFYLMLDPLTWPGVTPEDRGTGPARATDAV
ncbi:APH(3'') family aminoglycoside O-phosphotransferase [Mycolicibacterium goodii]|uniref:APH(3'') family aminoglycoside O-phosphotransferase n=1 Tax=Mycolicibacterium goodii TaxID=134601 RepID=UPI0018EB0DBB|nr:APH(3'') family aminoglycoside O-phosphotransferase [Mycolicibacterium goodii]MBU8816669.1 APH(3'') family aminoglycoside O-phosphotransferase [Mycolicibacterium goodii]